MVLIRKLKDVLPFDVSEQKLILVAVLLAACQILACLLVAYVTGIHMDPSSPEYWLNALNHAVSILILCVVLMLWVRPLKNNVTETTTELRRQSRRTSEISDVLRGHIGSQFESWGLTNAERDVALLTLKGLKISEIAEYRSSRPGTIKAHLHAIFKKADVSSRPELLATCLESFIELGTSTTEEFEMSSHSRNIIKGLVEPT